MIFFLILQAAAAVAVSDAEVFRDYHYCVMQQVATADLLTKNSNIIMFAKKSCGVEQTAAAMGLAADDAEAQDSGKAVGVPAEARMNALEERLTAEALSKLLNRRSKVR